jgi:hypothetical protein
MWPYFHVAPTVWTGTTGKEWRKLGPSYQVLGLYLQTAPAANPYGLYYVSRASIVDETGLALPTVQKVLAYFNESRYAFYEPEDQWCWVINMAARQLLKNGGALATSDNRIRGINAWYAALPDNPFLGPFFEKYHALVHLTTRRDGSHRLEPAAPSSAEPSLLDTSDAITVSTLSQEDLFDQWWREYPPRRRTGKKAARMEWAKIRPVPTAESVQAMIQVLIYQRSTRQWMKEGGTFIPEPERYLKKGRYQDEPAPDQPDLNDTDVQTMQALQAFEPTHD